MFKLFISCYFPSEASVEFLSTLKTFLYFLSICKIANNRNTFCCFFISRYLFVLKALFQIDIFIVQEYFFHSYNLFTESFYDYVDGFRKFGNEIYDGSTYDMIGCNEI